MPTARSILIVLTLAALAADEPTKKDEAQAIQGSWAVVSMSVGGKPIPEAAIKNLRCQFAEKTYNNTVAGEVVEPLLAVELGLWLRVTPQQLRPIDGIAKVRAPLLVIGGDADKHTTLSQTRALFAAAAAAGWPHRAPGRAAWGHAAWARRSGPDRHSRGCR